jgi:hypothetical protein
MARALGPRIQAQDAVVGQRHLPRHRQLAAAAHTDSGDGVMRGPERAHGDEGGALARQAGDAMAAGGLQRVRLGYRARL